MTASNCLYAPTPSAWSLLQILSHILCSFCNLLSALSKKLNLTPLERHTRYRPQRIEYNKDGGYGQPDFWRVCMTKRQPFTHYIRII